MRSTKSIILIVIALACGLIASIGISQMIPRAETTPEPTTETIYVAASNIPSWSQIEPEMVREEEWPIGKIPPDAIRSIEEFEGKSPRYPLYPGEPIVTGKLTDESGGQPSIRIPEGYQVFAIAVEIENALAGLVSPGDKVDVLCFIANDTRSVYRGADGSKLQLATGTRTILRNVTVFAVNDQIERQGEEESLEAKTVSLLVKPSESEKLLVAKELGTIHVALRKPGDESEIETEGASPMDLDGEAEEGTDGLDDEEPEQEDEDEGGIFDILNLMQDANSTAVDSSNATEASEPTFSTVIMSPDEVLGTYTFAGKQEKGKLSQLPTELMADFDDGDDFENSDDFDDGGAEDFNTDTSTEEGNAEGSESEAESEPEEESSEEEETEVTEEEDEWDADEEIDVDPSELGLDF